MKKKAWQFIDHEGTFRWDAAADMRSLYFPLCNSAGLMSSITPDLHGDIRSSFNSFLIEPVSRIGLSNSKVSRNFWIHINPNKIWSATGVSKDSQLQQKDICSFKAGLLWQSVNRRNPRIGLASEILSFIPASGEPVEIMQVTLTNISAKPIRYTAIGAIPIFARSAHNLFDHRHVTSLLQRITLQKFGLTVKPTLLFDEAGHKINTTTYFVLGIDHSGQGPQYIYPTQAEYSGDSGDLEAPEVIYQNRLPSRKLISQGQEGMGALRFRRSALKPKEFHSYIILLGINDNSLKIPKLLAKFNSPAKVTAAFTATKKFWTGLSSEISLSCAQPDQENWFRWVSIQPTLRKIFGCSYLPDFDYGKGGRGWRDLWQDALSLIIKDPQDARETLINNFSGVRIDGSNATIIGSKPGEFIADRNNISRVWMDHGVWPLLTINLYINQTGDLNILLTPISYFRDHQLHRSSLRDQQWTPEKGKQLKTQFGQIYEGSLLEHILVQTLVQFFNVGAHNCIRLENADWNDGLDMAGQHGESVAFSCMYAANLKTLCALLSRINPQEIVILKELKLLLDTLNQPVAYDNPQEKQALLKRYFAAVSPEVSGDKITLSIAGIIADLTKKAEFLGQHIRANEWLKEGFFNGYYDNKLQRVEGRKNGIVRMTLTGQTFPILSGVANDEQIRQIIKSVNTNLRDKKHGGLRLNTDFEAEQPDLGRAFSFVYGEKENGAFFNHMQIMYAYGLYARGYAQEGFRVLNTIFRMAADSTTSKIHPGLPEYFNNEGRGMYSYLTGSASWYVLTTLTQVFGVNVEYGNLLIEPKLVREQFASSKQISINAIFAEKRIEVIYTNPRRKEYGQYAIQNITLNAKTIAADINQLRYLIGRADFLAAAGQKRNTINVLLD